jgi:nucleoside-diphosphate-sugar epimerase
MRPSPRKVRGGELRHLLIGGDGLVGRALCAEIPSIAYTSRRRDTAGIKFDLLDDPASLPDADTVYLVAGVPSFMACEAGPTSWLVNVDGVIAVAERYRAPVVDEKFDGVPWGYTFLVYVSSNCVETAGGTALARQKAHVESYMRTRLAAIVRPAKITPETAPKFARFLASIGEARKPGVYRWADPHA